MTEAVLDKGVLRTLPSKTFVGLGFVLTAVLTAALTALGSLYVVRYQSDRLQMVQAVAAFQNSAAAFDPLVASYNLSLVSGHEDRQVKKALAQNIHQQSITLKASEPYLSPNAERTAEQYINRLADLNDALEATSDASNSVVYNQTVADIADTRETVRGMIRQRLRKFSLLDSPER